MEWRKGEEVMTKPKLAFYWASSCGGCEIAMLELGTDLVDIAKKVDIVFWPAALDFKYSDLESMPDKSIDACFFNGSIQTSENEHMAQLLRKKSRTLVAFGACAYGGGIPSLANTTNREQIFTRVYKENQTTDNPDALLPQPHFQVKEGELTIPQFFDTVRTLDQTVEVDYYVPGCPPVREKTWTVINDVIGGNLPARGSVIGASEKSLCEECKRVKGDRNIKKILRTYQVIPDSERCLLDQGIICMGPATRGGCGALCLDANMPCRGCYGPVPGVQDQGAKMLSALSSNIDADNEGEIQRIAEGVIDPIGTFYRYSLARSSLRRTKR
jgi:F420-non-reducing hydrogenase small subunit